MRLRSRRAPWPQATGPARRSLSLRSAAAADCCSAHQIWRVAPRHAGTEVRELPHIARCTGVMWLDTQMLRGETECECDGEIVERGHLPIEPVERAGAKAVSPR